MHTEPEISCRELLNDLPSFMENWNAVLVKEIRQTLKRRDTLWAFNGLLAVLAVSLIIFLLSRSSWQSPTLRLGSFCCLITMSVWQFLMYLYLPHIAFRLFADEHLAQAVDMLRLAPLSSHLVLRGKRLAVYGLGLVISSAVVPFLCFSYLLRGVSLLSLFIAILTVMISAVLLMELGLGCGAAARKPWSRIAFSFGLTALCVIGGLISGSLVAGMVQMPFEFVGGLVCFWPVLLFVLMMVTAFSHAQASDLGQVSFGMFRPLGITFYDAPALIRLGEVTLQLCDLLDKVCMQDPRRRLTKTMVEHSPAAPEIMANGKTVIRSLFGRAKDLRFLLPVTLPELDTARDQLRRAALPIGQLLRIAIIEAHHSANQNQFELTYVTYFREWLSNQELVELRTEAENLIAASRCYLQTQQQETQWPVQAPA